MIHGGGDTYIKPEMAEAPVRACRQPKEFWLVENAKHNQALHVAGEEYERRVLEFFDRHLGRTQEETEEAGRPAAGLAAPHVLSREESAEHANTES